LLALVWLLRPGRNKQGADFSRKESRFEYIEELHNLAPGAKEEKTSPPPDDIVGQVSAQSI
jgi:hypothetical protein